MKGMRKCYGCDKYFPVGNSHNIRTCGTGSNTGKNEDWLKRHTPERYTTNGRKEVRGDEIHKALVELEMKVAEAELKTGKLVETLHKKINSNEKFKDKLNEIPPRSATSSHIERSLGGLSGGTLDKEGSVNVSGFTTAPANVNVFENYYKTLGKRTHPKDWGLTGDKQWGMVYTTPRRVDWPEWGKFYDLDGNFQEEEYNLATRSWSDYNKESRKTFFSKSYSVPQQEYGQVIVENQQRKAAESFRNWLTGVVNESETEYDYELVLYYLTCGGGKVEVFKFLHNKSGKKPSSRIQNVVRDTLEEALKRQSELEQIYGTERFAYSETQNGSPFLRGAKIEYDRVSFYGSPKVVLSEVSGDSRIEGNVIIRPTQPEGMWSTDMSWETKQLEKGRTKDNFASIVESSRVESLNPSGDGGILIRGSYVAYSKVVASDNFIAVDSSRTTESKVKGGTIIGSHIRKSVTEGNPTVSHSVVINSVIKDDAHVDDVLVSNSTVGGEFYVSSKQVIPERVRKKSKRVEVSGEIRNVEIHDGFVSCDAKITQSSHVKVIRKDGYKYTKFRVGSNFLGLPIWAYSKVGYGVEEFYYDETPPGF